MSLTCHPEDRLLVIAPHPDDESLATGGLILSARKTGAQILVLFCTNGDNNPWPQRWVEKRWRIGHKERQRWGGRRHLEARQAIESLGLPPESACFLNFPDQGLTHRLLTAESATLDLLCHHLRTFRPTLLVIPSPHDLHPDHNALYILFQIALERVSLPGLQQWHFIVHCRRPELVPGKTVIHLSEEDRRAKREAILRHHTQMALSRKRFVAYARPTESYYRPSPPEASLLWHRITHGQLERGALTLTIALPSRRWRDIALLIVIETARGESIRWQLPLPNTSARVRLRNTVSGLDERQASIRISGRVAIIRAPLPSHREPIRIFTKLQRRMLFLDDNGWREIPIALPPDSSSLIGEPHEPIQRHASHPAAPPLHKAAAATSHPQTA